MTPAEEVAFEGLRDKIIGACQNTGVPDGAGVDTQVGALVAVAIKHLVADLDVDRDVAAAIVGKIATEVGRQRGWPWV